jgi:hypothetical protein
MQQEKQIFGTRWQKKARIIKKTQEREHLLKINAFLCGGIMMN